MRNLRLALIGAGASCDMYAPGLRHLPGVSVTAVADPNAAARQRAHDMLGATELHASVDALLAAGGCDAVIVASPPFCHREHVLAVARAGLPMLIEKPMARTVPEAEDMLEAGRQAGVLCMVGFNRRFLSPLWTATEMVRAGELGELFSTECLWTSWSLHPNNWRDSADCLGGVFQDHGAHSIDLACQWLGSPPRRVFAEARQIGPKIGVARGVEDHMTALFTHANGATSLHVHSRASHRPVSELYRLYGTTGTLELEYTGDWSYLAPDAWQMRLYRDAKLRPLNLVARRPNHELLGVLNDGEFGYYYELKLFAEALRQGVKTASPSGAEGLAAVRSTAAAFLSAAEGQAVTLDAAGRLDAATFGRLLAEMRRTT